MTGRFVEAAGPGVMLQAETRLTLAPFIGVFTVTWSILCLLFEAALVASVVRDGFTPALLAPVGFFAFFLIIVVSGVRSSITDAAWLEAQIRTAIEAQDWNSRPASMVDP